ncbi:MAG: hypothetical protein ACI9S8_001575 [Chlamydiales bacterium]|jgi:hypothetical protein
MQILISNGEASIGDENMQAIVSRLVVKIKALIEVTSTAENLNFDQASLQKTITYFLLSKLSRLTINHFDRNELEAYNNILRYIDSDYSQLDKELKSRTQSLSEARESLEKNRKEISKIKSWQDSFLASEKERELKSTPQIIGESHTKLKAFQKREEYLSEKIVQLNETSISTRTLMLSHKIQKPRLAIKIGL